jgi:hypothetical protein
MRPSLRSPTCSWRSALQFEETHFGQIHRYYESLGPAPDDDSGQQLELFDKDPPF